MAELKTCSCGNTPKLDSLASILVDGPGWEVDDCLKGGKIGYFVCCDCGCGAETPPSDDEGKVVKAWNVMMDAMA